MPWNDHFEFQKQYKICDYPGAKFLKVDFHFHTPASGSDYKEGSATYDDIAKKLSDEKIDVVFVTDHNTWEGIKPLQEACQKLGSHTTVFPGAELTLTTKAICLLQESSDGKEVKKVEIVKFHCLVLLPPIGDYENQIRSLVTSEFKNNDILNYQPVDRVVAYTVEEVAAKVKEWGGIFIPAHLNQGKGTKSRSLDDLYSDSMTIEMLGTLFDAVEIRKPESAMIFDGHHETHAKLKIPKISTVLGSDAHDLKTIGRKSTFLLVEGASFTDIRESLRHPDRVRLTSFQETLPQILSVNINGNFLGKQSISFSQRMTSLIGSKGSGKTAILEMLRLGLGYSAKIDNAYLEHLLGPAGKVSIHVKGNNGDEFLFIRKSGENAPTIFTKGGGTLERGAIIPGIFNVEIRGWGETTKLAVESEEQIRLIDNSDLTGEIKNLSNETDSLRSQSKVIFQEIVPLIDVFKNLKTEVDALLLKESTLERLQLTNMSEKQTLKEKRDTENAMLSAILGQSTTQKDSINIAILQPSLRSQLSSLQKAIEQGKVSSPEQVKVVTDFFAEIEKREIDYTTQSKEVIKSFESLVQSTISNFADRNKPLDEEYQKEFSSLSVEDQTTLLQRNSVVKQIAVLPSKKASLETSWVNIKEKIDELIHNFISIQENIEKRSAKRSQIVEAINSALAAKKSGSKILFHALEKWQGSAPGGLNKTYFKEVSEELGRLNKDNLSRSLIFDRLSSNVGYEAAQILDDNSEVQFEIYPGTWKQASQLSAGQKSTAVLPILLMTAKSPVILDQPEDNLDNKYIGANVVGMFTDIKEQNQTIITSHNASIVVMSDSDFIIEMSDAGNQGKVVKKGFLNGPDSEIALSVLDVLDGGKDALLSRFTKYGKLIS